MRIYTEQELEQEFGQDEVWNLRAPGNDLLDHQGKGEFVLVWSAGHGGGEHSRHRSLRAAIRERRRTANRHDGTRIIFGRTFRTPGACACGGPSIVTDVQYDHLPAASNASSAWIPAQRG